MSKYAPKHRGEPERTGVSSGVRKTVAYSGVAIAATGVAVSTGVLQGTPNDIAMASGAAKAAPTALTAEDLLERENSFSRSTTDRRAGVDSAKASLLNATAGKAKTKRVKVDLASLDVKSIARALMPEYGLRTSEFSCLDRIWTQESGWRWNADNPSSSAYGIPQALPGSKMSSFGSDWATNPETQIRWGLDYIHDRYGSACSAWGFKAGHGWY